MDGTSKYSYRRAEILLRHPIILTRASNLNKKHLRIQSINPAFFLLQVTMKLKLQKTEE